MSDKPKDFGLLWLDRPPDYRPPRSGRLQFAVGATLIVLYIAVWLIWAYLLDAFGPMLLLAMVGTVPLGWLIGWWITEDESSPPSRLKGATSS